MIRQICGSRFSVIFIFPRNVYFFLNSFVSTPPLSNSFLFFSHFLQQKVYIIRKVVSYIQFSPTLFCLHDVYQLHYVDSNMQATRLQETVCLEQFRGSTEVCFLIGTNSNSFNKNKNDLEQLSGCLFVSGQLYFPAALRQCAT